MIGLVGLSGAGKNKVAEELVKQGYQHFDLDIIAHDILNDGGEVFVLCVAEFGIRIIGSDGFIDRSVLGDIVFCDATKLKKLGNIIEPPLINYVIKRSQTEKVILNGSALYDCGLIDNCEFVVYVQASFCTRLFRLMKRDTHRTFIQIIQRMWAQRNISEKLYNDPVIFDNGFGKFNRSFGELMRKLK